ncbi:leucine-rich repeat domain-containing protein [Patescibacteria group bacterium]|nr:MAG: leucine-rich repeat domain-containing protein [Patescibacteria group bacterium]
MVDPTCGLSCPAGYAEYDPSTNTWQLKTPVSAVHIYDITSYEDNDLWLFGADSDGAAVWRSLDDGDTWLRVRSRATQDRYYWGTVVNGKLVAHSGTGFKGPVEKYDGTDWFEQALPGSTDSFCGIGGQQGGPTPVVFKGRMICRDSSQYFAYDGDSYNTLNINAGTALAGPSCQVSGGDYITTDQYLYVLCTDANSSGTGQGSVVLRTRNLTHWDRILDVPYNASALDVDESTNTLYIGTTDSKLYAGTLPDSDIDDPLESYCFDFNADTGGVMYYYEHQDNNSSNPLCAADVVIPSTIGGSSVRSLRNMNTTMVTSVVIPDSVVTIEDYAFLNSELTSVNIPDSVVSIGRQAFYQSKLESVMLGSSVATIGEEAFASNKLESVSIPNSVTSIADSAFELNNTSPHTLDFSTIFQEAMATWADPDNPTEEEMSALYELLVTRMTEYFQSANFVRLYTVDPSNPNGLEDSSRVETLADIFADLFPPGFDLSASAYYGGHLINPAQITLMYQSGSGQTLLPASTNTGVGLTSYRVAENPANDLSLYYRIGQTQTFTPPNIAGYTTPGVYSLTFGAGDNSHIFIYRNPQASLLASTGVSRKALLLVASATLCISIVLFWQRRRIAHFDR